MTVIAVVHHLERPFLGHAGEPLRSHGATLREVDRRRGDALPGLEEIDGVVSLGGEQSALDVERDPVLGEEREWLRAVTARGVPVLGVCLGAQLLATALGGSVYALSRCNLAWKPMELTPAGADDPIGGGLDAPVALLWNHDAIVAPPGAVELLRASNEGCVAFRHGARAWGVQFHPEVTADALDDWWVRWGPAQLAQAGVEEAAARADDARHLGGQAALSEMVFGRFAMVVVEAARRDSGGALRRPGLGTSLIPMPEDDGLDQLSSHELHDLAVRRATHHADVRFFYDLMKALPVAEAGAGDLAEAENDEFHLSAHVNDLTDSGRGEVADLLRPIYLEYLRKHNVTAPST